METKGKAVDSIIQYQLHNKTGNGGVNNVLDSFDCYFVINPNGEFNFNVTVLKYDYDEIRNKIIENKELNIQCIYIFDYNGDEVYDSCSYLNFAALAGDYSHEKMRFTFNVVNSLVTNNHTLDNIIESRYNFTISKDKTITDKSYEYGERSFI